MVGGEDLACGEGDDGDGVLVGDGEDLGAAKMCSDTRGGSSSGVANPKYNLDIDRLVATYGHRIIAGEQVETEAFATWIAAAASKV